jgi:signal peptidase II
MRINLKIYFKRAVVVLICIFCFVGCDQSAKRFVKNEFETSSIQSYAGGLIRLVYVENPGAMLSFGAKLPNTVRFLVFIIGISVVLTSFVIYIIVSKKENFIKELSLILIVSGGLGNLTDRIFNNGKVIDFLIIGIGGLNTAVFNLADVFITLGTLLFLFSKTQRENAK